MAVSVNKSFFLFVSAPFFKIGPFEFLKRVAMKFYSSYSISNSPSFHPFPFAKIKYYTKHVLFLCFFSWIKFLYIHNNNKYLGLQHTAYFHIVTSYQLPVVYFICIISLCFHCINGFKLQGQSFVLLLNEKIIPRRI